MDIICKHLPLSVHTPIIGLYFSGEYCKYCKEFTPALIDQYPKLLENDIDIIYVSSDKDIDMFNRYFQDQPWKCLDYESTEADRKLLRERFGIKTIPALLFFDTKTGNLIMPDGRSRFRDDPAQAILDLILPRLSFESLPVDERLTLDDLTFDDFNEDF